VTTDSKTITTILEQVSARFSRADLSYGHGTDNPDDEALWLICAELNLPPEILETNPGTAVSPEQQSRILELSELRIATRKPLAYLINEAWFAGLKFYVDERVIIPRSHISDCILDEFQPWFGTGKIRHILDLCTGSGCIAIASALALPGVKVDAVDISADALAVADININNYQLQKRVQTIDSDLFAGLGRKQYDLILANPPYVGDQEYAELPAEYHHEPKLALYSQHQGLEIPINILSESGKYLSPTGCLIMEVGASAQLLQELLPQIPFLWLATESEETSVFLLTSAQLTEYQHVFAGLLH